MLVTVAALCAVTGTFAQKNSILLYGRAGISATKSEDSSGNKSTQTQATLAPAIGYWFTDNVAAGLLFSLGYQKLKTNYVPKSVTVADYKGYEFGAFVRYRRAINDLFFVHADLYGVYGTGTSTVNDTLKIKGDRVFTIAVLPALGINITRTSAVTLALGSVYYTMEHNPENKAKTSGFRMDFGQLLSIGFQKNFPLKRHRTALQEP